MVTVTKVWLPQKARFYAGLRTIFDRVTIVTIKNAYLYREKNILQSLYNI